MRRFLPLFGVLVLLGAASSRADEATRRDGVSASGKLSFDGDVFRFTSNGKDEPFDQIDVVHRGKPSLPARECGWMLHLVGGDSFPVRPLQLTEQELRVRTSWADEVRVPRPAVERIGQWPGRQVVAVAGEGTSFKATGEVARGGLELRSPFVKTASRRVTLELGFVRDGKPAPVSVELSSPEARIGVAAPEAADVAGRLNRDGRSHLLVAAFDADTLQLSVDGYVLWSRDHGPGTLREVRLVSAGEGSETVRIEQLTVWSHTPPIRTPPSSRPSRDRLVTIENTELYGVFPRFETAGPVIDVRDKPVVVPWGTVRELGFGDLGGVESSTVGEHAELTLQVAGQPAGRITGRVKTWTDKQVELEHPRLGTLTIPAERITEVRPLFRGRRLVVAAGSHHLGIREIAGYRPAKPEGTAARHLVELDDSLVGAEVVFEARTTRSPSALTFLLNDEKVGSLRVTGDDPTRYRLSLPMAGRRGRNELEIRLAPNPRPGDVELRNLRLEIPMTRPVGKLKTP